MKGSRAKAIFSLLFSLLLISACHSTYKGQMLEKDGRILNEPSGIPYTLTRPEFKITRVASESDETVPKYELDITYIPDASRRYTLNVSPSIFADIDFAINLEDDGRLSAVSNTYTDRIAPTIKSLGTFTGNVIETFEKGVFTDLSIRESIAWRILSCARLQKNAEANKICDANTYCQKVGSQLVKRIRTYKNDDFFINEFHFINSEEKECLYCARQCIQKAGFWVNQHRYLTAVSDIERYYMEHKSDKIEFEFAQFVRNRIQAGDYGKIKEIKDLFVKYLQNNDEQYRENTCKKIIDIITFLQEKVNCKNVKLNEDQIDRWYNLLTKLPEKDPVPLNAPAYDALTLFIEMPNDMWRARHVLYLEKKISEAEFQILFHPLSKNKYADNIQKDEKLRADTIGVRAEYERLSRIKKFLATIPNSGIRHRNNRVLKDYEIARVEAELLENKIQQARAKLLLQQKPQKAKIKSLSQVVIYHEKDKLIAYGNDNKGYFKLTQNDEDEFQKSVNESKEKSEDANKKKLDNYTTHTPDEKSATNDKKADKIEGEVGDKEKDKTGNTSSTEQETNKTSKDKEEEQKKETKAQPEFVISLERLGNE